LPPPLGIADADLGGRSPHFFSFGARLALLRGDPGLCDVLLRVLHRRLSSTTDWAAVAGGGCGDDPCGWPMYIYI
jgi:hypothetical protein